VPMLGWPRFADQNTNCHYITHVWKIGLQFESQVRGGSAVVPKEEIARKVRQIMAAEGMDMEVDKIRTNSRKFQKAASKAVAKGGSSQTALTTFVELIQKRPKHWSPPQDS
jgi:aminoglycoside N3'-acetyltransferase